MRILENADASNLTPDEIERLIRAGVLEAVDDDRPPIPFSAPGTPTTDRFVATSAIQPSLALVIDVILVQLIASLAVRIFPMRVMVRHLARLRLRGECANGDMTAADRLAAAFRRACVLLKSEGNCLPRTLGFVWLARRRGYRASLVIGVRINPFSAHCWPQCGDVVLNDRIDRVALFKPILRI